MSSPNFADNSDEIIVWNDVSSAAGRMFRIWGAGGELEWAEECWGHFQKAGIAGQVSDIARTSSLLRLVTLARIYEEFSGFAWEENPETPIDYFAENLNIDPVALGILAARATSDSFDDTCDEDGSQLRELALTFVSDAQRKEIYACLCAAYGDDIQLFSRMSRTHPSSDRDSFDEFEVTAGNCQGLQYVQNGFGS